jgi:hypothetical protein
MARTIFGLFSRTALKNEISQEFGISSQNENHQILQSIGVFLISFALLKKRGLDA